MVRTKQSVAFKLSIGKLPKVAACKAAAAAAAVAASSSSPSCSPRSTSSKNKYSGGNPVHPREIPVWQKSITCFFPAQNNDERPRPSANDHDGCGGDGVDDDDDDDDDDSSRSQQVTDTAGSSKM